jgi:hypothetical protein
MWGESRGMPSFALEKLTASAGDPVDRRAKSAERTAADTPEMEGWYTRRGCLGWYKSFALRGSLAPGCARGWRGLWTIPFACA